MCQHRWVECSDHMTGAQCKECWEHLGCKDEVPCKCCGASINEHNEERVLDYEQYQKKWYCNERCYNATRPSVAGC